MRSWAAQSGRVRGSSLPPLSLRPTPGRHRPPIPRRWAEHALDHPSQRDAVWAAGSSPAGVSSVEGQGDGRDAHGWPAIGCARERGSSQEPGSLGFRGWILETRSIYSIVTQISPSGDRSAGSVLRRAVCRPSTWPTRSLNCAESLVRDRQPRRGTDARDPAWGGRPGRDRRAIGERWRSGWAYVRSLPDRLTSTASVCRRRVVRCWKRSSRSSVPALPVSVASKLAWRLPRWSTRPSTSGHVSSTVQVGAPTPRL
jgi:hypothetical protein